MPLDNDNSEDPITGVRSLTMRDALRELVREARENREMIERLYRDSWLQLARESLTRTLYQGTRVTRGADGQDVVTPAGLSIRVDTVLILLLALVLAFGSSRAYTLVQWLGDKVPSVSIGSPLPPAP